MRRQSRRMLGSLALPFLLAGCGGGGGSSPPSGSPTPVLSVSTQTPDGLTATLSEDRSSVSIGGSVAYTFTLSNHTAQPITFLAVTYGNAPVEETSNSLQITDAAGNTTFFVGGPSGSPQDGPSFTLAPGASAMGGVAVEPGAFPTSGEYTATAVFRLRIAPGSSVQTTPVGAITVTAR